MSVDLNSFFNNLRSYTADEENTDTVQPEELFTKNLSEMSEEEKDEFYKSKDFKQFSAKSNGLTSNSVNYQGRTVQEIFGLGGKTNRYSYNCFSFLETDHEDYLDIVDFSPEMQNTIAEGEALLPTFKYLWI